MNSKDYRNLQEAYLDVYALDENRMVSRMEKMPTPPAKVGKATHSIKDLTPSKPPTPEEKAKARKALGLGEAVDLYDIILSHLLDEGYADTEQAAEAIMVNMSEEWRESIVETRMDPRGRPASGPMNVYANPKGKPSQAHLDAVKSYDAEQKKKTPEQRKAEQDAYRERQMNNK
jgi:hypothetical protein